MFVGIDAPEFNLRLARDLRVAGIPTVQYVSPQVWAWRQSRARSIHESVDAVLCLLPFEKRFYDAHGMHAEFVGHPLADAIPMTPDRAGRAAALDIDANARSCRPAAGQPARRSRAAWRRILPRRRAGSPRSARSSSSSRRWRMRWCAEIFSQALARHAPAVDVRLIEGQAQTALIAADVAMVASGTASLEAALCKRPMVVVYRLGAMTAWVLRRLNLVKSKFFAQPNLLADRRVVGEYFQEEIVPESIGAELLMWLDDAERRSALEREFARIHADLRRDAGMRAAQAILELVESRGRAATESP